MDRYVLHDVLREYLPLKQGLRPHYWGHLLNLDHLALRVSSIKTRIKTHKFEHTKLVNRL